VYPDIIAIGIPLMIACVVIELIYDRRRPQPTYRFNAAVSNISCGSFEQVTGFISKGLFLALYVAMYENFRLMTLQDGVGMFLLLMILVDLVFYGFHRFSHRCSLLWAGHMVHHETEEFNLTVALRRSVMQEFTIIWVYLPFAVLGFSPGLFFLAFAAHNLYQFLIHTSYLPEARWLGKIFNTPYHHEVHHSRNACYIDKNFAGVFIIWDKMFGTFAHRTEAPEFGVDQLTTTLNPVKAQVTTLAAVLAEARRRSGLRAKLRALFGPPDYLAWTPPEPMHAEPRQKRPVFDPRLGRLDWWLVGLTFVAIVVATSVYRNTEPDLRTWHKVLAMVAFTAVLYGLGRLLDQPMAAAHASPPTAEESADGIDGARS
jgi:alkylglycerol monooxygenase